MEFKTYRVYISHAWDYGDEYQRLVDMLNDAPKFYWSNYSVPKDDPVHTKRHSRSELEAGLTRHILPVGIMLVLSGMYTSYSDWMQIEMSIANKYDKPIIGILPWGSQRVPTEVQIAARELVGWNTDSIVGSIRKYSK